MRRHHSQKRQALHNVYLLYRRLLHWPNIKLTLAERLLLLKKQIMVLIRAQTAITIRQTTVTVYFHSTQLLPFAFARR